ncbi:outer membrane protein assembly factor BamB family protein [Streptomyces thermolilacinus]|uniref:PQQ-binding-like beta-propeller repeat protein n=1 Tax=Streptomyces thermolilacinus SPC6 TaxID=1306406 RepID=A0A1D3DMT9_9ACTN|nr:PQQ-binding-like beta-propeller repeat protein [Streptomyces thermolilacinus]OEJ93647.1 hypothetical protein J116_003360 [Streptomyces thermolilacinus SPC6]
MAAGIPRGVVGADGRRAVVHDRHGTLIALDTRTGTVLWRRGRRLRPCALTDGAVVAVRLGGAPEAYGQGGAGAAGPVTVVVLDADEGTERWESPPLDLPSWARPSLVDTPVFTLAAEAAGGGRAVVLRWAARDRYEGGAPPGPGTPEDTVREARGAVRVDLAGPSPAALPAPPGPVEEAGEPGTVAESPHGAGPLGRDVLEAGRVGVRRVELAVRRGAATDALVLRAVDPGADAPAWEVVLDEGPRRPPPPPRP